MKDSFVSMLFLSLANTVLSEATSLWLEGTCLLLSGALDLHEASILGSLGLCSTSLSPPWRFWFGSAPGIPSRFVLTAGELYLAS